MFTLSTLDKVSQRLTANAAVTDSVVAVQTIKMLVLESRTVEMTSDERWKFPRLFLSLMRPGTTVAFVFFFFFLFYQTAEFVKFRHIVKELSKVTSSPNSVF